MQAREIINSKKCYLSDLLPTINLILFRCIQSSTSPTHFMKIKCDKSINQQNYLLKKKLPWVIGTEVPMKSSAEGDEDSAAPWVEGKEDFSSEERKW